MLTLSHGLCRSWAAAELGEIPRRVVCVCTIFHPTPATSCQLSSQILGVSRLPERHKEAWVGQSLHQSQQVSGMQDGIELLVCAKFLGLLGFAEFFSFLRCRRL